MRTNEPILQKIGEMRGGLSLLQRATSQKMYVMRADDLEKGMILACGEEERGGEGERPWKR